MATIKPIEGRSVHQIQSGQVIVDLNSVAKELVENALDAGATAIEVRFKNYGLDSIEVQDNGAGIAPEDFDTIALKHYTSKLSTYDDLGSLTTFGFRGEALSSLCALSHFHIITARADDGPKGTKLEFEPSGKVKGTSVVAAKQGTTVVVENLFHNLPVRRKELEKSIKREYNKVLNLLNAYACIGVGIKFSVSNQVPKGKKTVAFSTHSNPNTRENIANVYGAKTLLALIPLNLNFEMDPANRPGATQSARNWSTQEDSGSRQVRITGHISRPVVGEGRQTPDRQMFFVNSRPCTLPQVSKAFNEVYKSFNISQSPFIFADIQLDTSAYDVNVSPDKRTILLHDQTALLERLKASLAELFEAHDQSVPQAQLLDRRLPSFKPPTFRHRESTDMATSTDEHVASTRALGIRETSQSPTQSPIDPIPAKETDLPGFVKASLIERFAGRDTEERTAYQPKKRQKRVSPEDQNTLRVDSEGEAEPTADGGPEDAGSPPVDPEFDSFEHHQQIPKPVQDFNARIASQERKQDARDKLSSGPRQSGGEAGGISTITQSPRNRSSQSSIQTAFDRMRPMRTPGQQATITVGDTTSVSTIGSFTSASKRARIHTPKFSLSGSPLSQTPRKPTFVNSLRNFAAPGTQYEDDDAMEDEREEEVNPDSSMSDGPTARSPSPTKPALSKETIGLSTDEINQSSSALTSDPSHDISQEDNESDAVAHEDKDGSDDEYIDDSEKKVREEARIAKMIAEAEEAAARPTEMNIKRAKKLSEGSRRKYQTLGLIRETETSILAIRQHAVRLKTSLEESDPDAVDKDVFTATQLDTSDPEERLSLTVTKSDFHSMRIVGQFNTGFILAVRPPSPISPTADLFIIDQHASDEKYNFEKLAATTMLISQQLVRPRPLQLTAIEEEIIMSNEHALTANGFVVNVDTSGNSPVGQRAKVTALPMSKGATFTIADLEELLTMVDENTSSASHLEYIPRPSKVRKLLASRACRKSIMIGKTLRHAQMEKVVRHMGEMDKPWSCPHGRPTMRHLFGLQKWEGWKEGDGVAGTGVVGQKTDWARYLREQGVS